MCVYTCSQFGRKRRSFQHNTYTVHFAQYDICSMKDISIVLMLQSNVLNHNDDILYIKYVQHIQYIHIILIECMYLYSVHILYCTGTHIWYVHTRTLHSTTTHLYTHTCTHIHAHPHPHNRTCTHAHPHPHMYACTRSPTPTHPHMYTCTHLYTCTHEFFNNYHTNMHICITHTQL